MMKSRHPIHSLINNDSENNKKSVVKKAFKSICKRIARNDSTDISMKSPDMAIEIIFKMIVTLNKMDRKEEAKLKLKSLKENTSKKNTLPTFNEVLSDSDSSNNESDEQINQIVNEVKKSKNAKVINPAFMYFVLSSSPKEFHESFNRFYKECGTDKSMLINQTEFYSAMNSLAQEDKVGQDRIYKCFSKITPEFYRNNHRLEEAFYNSKNKNLNMNLVNGVFDMLSPGKVVDDKGQKNRYMDYLKALPLFIGFYTEIVKKEVYDRRKKLFSLQGFKRNGEVLFDIEKSLLSKFEAIGFSFKKNYEKELTYSDIEKALLLFKNNHFKTFSHEQLESVTKDINKKYKWQSRERFYEKAPLFNRQFLSYVTFKICVHSYCNHMAKSNKGDSVIIQEYAFWNAAMYENDLES